MSGMKLARIHLPHRHEEPPVRADHPSSPASSPLEMFHDNRLDWLARYVIIESHRGRGLREILADEAVASRCDEATRAHLLDMPAVVEALCADAVARVRSEIARGPQVPPPARHTPVVKSPLGEPGPQTAG